MKKIISLCLTATMLFLLFSSCANPPGEGNTTSKILQPAGTPSTEKIVQNTEPVDLSVLSKDDLGKITKDVRNILVSTDKSSKHNFFVTIIRDITVAEVDELADKKMSDYITKANELESEIQDLSKQLQALKDSSESDKSLSITPNNTDSLSQRIAKLQAELNELTENNDGTYDETRISIFTDTNKPKIDAFMKRHELDPDSAAYISYVMSEIHDIPLTPEQVLEIAKDSDVARISYIPKSSDKVHSNGSDIENNGSVCTNSDEDNTITETRLNRVYDIVDGEVAVNNGSMGSGITIGIVDGGVPDLNAISNVTLYNSNETEIHQHATNVATIIKKMVPSCSIIAISSTNAARSVITSLTMLLENNPDIDVVNISMGKDSNTGKYTDSSYAIDNIIETFKKPIVMSSGNEENYVSQYGLASHVICVGAINHSGTNPAASNAFSDSDTLSSYMQFNGDMSTGEISMINKPDFCAPGDLSYNYANYETNPAYTSHSAPVVTGTIAQMMSNNYAYHVNSSIRHRDLMAKASLMASCFYNAGTLEDPINFDESNNNIFAIYGIPTASDFEGAGVINAGACYDMSGYYRYENYTLTSLGTTSKGLTITDTSKPLRVAIAWRTEIPNSEDVAGQTYINFNNSNIMLHIYKEGSAQAIGRSTAFGFLQNSMQEQEGPVTNYQYVEIPASTLATKGAGNYIIKIIFNSTQNNTMSVPLSLAWSQYVNTDA